MNIEAACKVSLDCQLALATGRLGPQARQAMESAREYIDQMILDRTREDKKYDELQAIGKTAYESIAAMVAALDCNYDRLELLRSEAIEGGKIWQAGDCEDADNARDRISEDALEITYRSGWVSTAIATHEDMCEICILITTGGPAVRIIADYNMSTISRPRLEVQDWGAPWTEYREYDTDILERYCRSCSGGFGFL